MLYRESICLIDLETPGLLASIALTKDAAFAPDERRWVILTETATSGTATARAVSFRNPDPVVLIHADRRWMPGLIGGDSR